jgi:hypothetical protein
MPEVMKAQAVERAFDRFDVRTAIFFLHTAAGR